MQPVNREQWREWQSHPVTERVKAAIQERIQEAKDQLSDPNSDPNRDRFLKGMIWAFKEVLEAKPEITEEDFDVEV